MSQSKSWKFVDHHTSGSMSFARSGHELAIELGRPPRRDELYIKTHTRKNGVPSRLAEPIINKLKAIVEAHPELKNKTIQEGDAFAAACGEKEPRGRVRALGLGPTPQDIGTPGLKCYTPTRLQMEVLARKKAEREKVALQQRIEEMEQEMQERRMANEIQNMEVISQNGSNSRHNLSRRSEEHVEEAHHDAQFVEDEDYADNENYEHYDEGEQVHLDSRAAAATKQPIRATLLHPSPIDGAVALQPRQCSPTSAAPSAPPRNDNPPHFAHDELVGKDVILYAISRAEQPVAKGTIVSTNPDSELGGMALGKQCCEVVVNVVLKRDAFLHRPYGYVKNMADAHLMPIAWPYNRLKVSKASRSS